MSFSDLFRTPLAMIGAALEVGLSRSIDPHLRHFLALRSLTENLNAPQPCSGAAGHDDNETVPLDAWWNDSWWDKNAKEFADEAACTGCSKPFTLDEMEAAEALYRTDVATVTRILANGLALGKEFDELAVEIVDALIVDGLE
jgi:hypothetical protein